MNPIGAGCRTRRLQHYEATMCRTFRVPTSFFSQGLVISFALLFGCGSPESVHPSSRTEPQTGPQSVCGDGIVQSGEVCDPGQDPNCNSYCTHFSGPCGDGIRQPDAEECDDGNTIPGDGCTQCRVDPGFSCSSNDPAI